MAKQELIDKIIRDAEERARSIISDAENKAAEMRIAAHEESSRLLENARLMAEASAPEVIGRRRAMAELESRKLVLEAKQELIASVYAEALRAVKASDRYEDLLVKMILSVAEDGDTVVFAASDYDRVDRKRILAEAMRQGGIRLTQSEERGAFGGGIVLRGKDCDKNLSLEVELETLRSEENIAAKVLFS